MSKEPGQLAYEAWWGWRWRENAPRMSPDFAALHGQQKADWARVESAIRAAALEEAAKVADRYGGEWQAKAGNCSANSQGEAVCESASAAGYEIAAAIRALKERKDG